MRAGLVELDRWLADRVRTGLAAPELADSATWDRMAARLVDAQCGGLANRVKRVATRVGDHSRWHEDVLEEMAVLHALARGALRTSMLPDDLGDGVHAATGLTTAKDDVLAGVPSTAQWHVVGQSRVREDRITVQRTWLLTVDDQQPGDAPTLPTWAMLLAFGAFGNEVVTEHAVGSLLHADVFWYPGATPLRALVGPRPRCAGVHVAHSAGARRSSRRSPQQAGPSLPSHGSSGIRCASASCPRRSATGAGPSPTQTGAVPIVPGFWRLAEMVAVSGGRPITIMGEWSADGVLPLTMWTAGQVIAL